MDESLEVYPVCAAQVTGASARMKISSPLQPAVVPRWEDWNEIGAACPSAIRRRPNSTSCAPLRSSHRAGQGRGRVRRIGLADAHLEWMRASWPARKHATPIPELTRRDRRRPSDTTSGAIAGNGAGSPRIRRPNEDEIRETAAPKPNGCVSRPACARRRDTCARRPRRGRRPCAPRRRELRRGRSRARERRRNPRSDRGRRLRLRPRRRPRARHSLGAFDRVGAHRPA